MRKFSSLIILTLTLLATLFLTSVAFASETDGTVSGYAWSDKIGWINFGVATGNIHLTDTVLSGYAWSDNYGWINLAPTKSGVKNDAEGNLSGSAWGWNLGWVDFASTKVSSSGIFTGTASGDNFGTINFSCSQCNVHTDWRPASSRGTVTPPPSTPTSTGNNGGGPVYGPPTASYSVMINNGSEFTNNQSVVLTLNSGDGAVAMEISNYADFSNSKKTPYNNYANWNLLPGDGIKTVYVKFYTKYDIASPVTSDYIILDTIAPELKITDIKEKYIKDQEVMIAGTTEPGAEVNLFLDNSYGSFVADSSGNWFVSLGVLGLGSHKLEMFAKDKAGNIGQIIKASFEIVPLQALPTPKPQIPGFISPILENIQQGLRPLLPNLVPQNQVPVAQIPILERIGQGLYSLLPQIPTKTPQVAIKIQVPKETPILDKIGQGLYSLLQFMPQPQIPDLAQTKPVQVVLVPKIAPPSLAGSWDIFPMGPVRQFVLAPIPKDIAVLENKFPKLEKTFKDVGVAKITDIQKIKNSNLSLPGLTETLGLSKIEITPGKFIPAKGIPLAKLTPGAKEKIPSEIIFAKTGGGLVDYNIALSLNDKGATEQKISTITGSPLQLIFKTDAPAKRVRGYIVFKSKRPSISMQVPLDSMAMSGVFSAPSFAAALAPSIQIPLEGAKAQVAVDSAPPAGLEKRLVIAQFDYQDTGNGVYTATIQAPVVDGEYEVVTVVDYEKNGLLQPVSKEVKLITVVDPEGYVYEKQGDKETRILGAVVSLYWQNPQTKQYELWAAKDYQQENPQTTDVRGTYSFLVPEGYYYLKVDAPGYLSYDGKPFEVKEGSGVHINIELKTKYWWLNIIDWKTAMLVLVVLMLVYNFYKDRKREKWMSQQKS